MYSYAPDEDEDESEADTEVEGTKTPGSIMYSGSCSSVKSNGTLEDKAQAVGSSSGAESSDEDAGGSRIWENEDPLLSYHMRVVR